MFALGPNNCLLERKENLNNHYFNSECNREIKNKSIENTRHKIEKPSRTNCKFLTSFNILYSNEFMKYL